MKRGKAECASFSQCRRNDGREETKVEKGEALRVVGSREPSMPS